MWNKWLMHLRTMLIDSYSNKSVPCNIKTIASIIEHYALILDPNALSHLRLTAFLDEAISNASQKLQLGEQQREEKDDLPL